MNVNFYVHTKTTMNELSYNLKNLLLSHQMSENELARRTGISQQVINRILSGQNINPTIATLRPLANYFSVTISQLLSEANFDDQTNINYLNTTKIPLINWQNCHEQIFNTNNIKHSFALIMENDKLEPFIPAKSILIFDRTKKLKDKDYAIIYISEQKKVIFNRIFFDNNAFFIKNEQHNETNLTKLSLGKDQLMGILLEIRILL